MPGTHAQHLAVPVNMSSSDCGVQKKEPRLRSNFQVVLVGNQWHLDGTELCLTSGSGWVSLTQGRTGCSESPAQCTLPTPPMSKLGAPEPIYFKIWLLNAFWVTKET